MTGHYIKETPPHFCLAKATGGGLWTICDNQCKDCKLENKKE